MLFLQVVLLLDVCSPALLQTGNTIVYDFKYITLRYITVREADMEIAGISLFIFCNLLGFCGTSGVFGRSHFEDFMFAIFKLCSVLTVMFLVAAYWLL